MNLRIVTTSEQLHSLETAWGNLTQEPLRSFDWNVSWWKNFGDGFDLRVYCFEQDGEVVGIAPFFVDRWMGQQRLRFLGSGSTCTDYAQIIVKPSARSDFETAIAADIRHSNAIGMLELEGICDDASDELICDCLGRSGKDNSFWRYARELEPTWVLKIPETWEQFVSQSSKSLRRKLRKATKRMEEGEIKVQSTLIDLDFESAFATLVELHQERFVSKGEPGVFSDSRFTGFLKEAVGSLGSKNRAEILVGYSEGEPFVAHLYLISDEGPQLYQSGVGTDKLHLEPGHAIFTYAVRKAIENRYPTFDFLRGSEPYKPYWGAVPRRLLKIRCVSKQVGPTAVNQAYRLLRSLKHGCSNLLNQMTPSRSS